MAKHAGQVSRQGGIDCFAISIFILRPTTQGRETHVVATEGDPPGETVDQGHFVLPGREGFEAVCHFDTTKRAVFERGRRLRSFDALGLNFVRIDAIALNEKEDAGGCGALFSSLKIAEKRREVDGACSEGGSAEKGSAWNLM